MFLFTGGASSIVQRDCKGKDFFYAAKKYCYFRRRIFEKISAMAVEKRYVEVLLPLKLKDTMSYRLPQRWTVEAGSWVQVPLRGRARFCLCPAGGLL